jgi:hypothetical protein
MRPSWQIDLKWAAGLLSCVAILVTGVLFSLAHMTGGDTARPLATAIISLGIEDRVTDEEYTAIQAQAAEHPEAPLRLAPVALDIRGSDIAGLKKDQAANVVAGKVADVLYEKGSDEAEKLLVKPANSDKDAISLGPAGALSSDMHSTFQTYFYIAAVTSVLLLTVVVAMSRGAGRIGAPAFVVALTTAPMAALWALAAQAVGEGDSGDKPAMLAARLTARTAAGDLRSEFLLIAGVAVGVAALSFVGGIVYAVVRRVRKPGAASVAPLASTGKPYSLVENEPAS